MKQILIASVAAVALSLPAMAQQDNIRESNELVTQPVEQPAQAEYRAEQMDKDKQFVGTPKASGNEKGEIVTGPVEQPNQAEYQVEKDRSTTGAGASMAGEANDRTPTIQSDDGRPSLNKGEKVSH